MNFINHKQLISLTDNMADNDYKKYLLKVIEEIDDT